MRQREIAHIDNSKLNIALISNVVIQHFLHPQIKEIFNEESISVNISAIPYLECKTEAAIRTLNKAEMVIVLLNFEELYPDYYNEIYINQGMLDEIKNDAMKKCMELYLFLKQNVACEILWFSFEDYYNRYDEVYGNQYLGNGLVDNLNIEFAQIISETDVQIDLKRLIAKIGIKNAFNITSKFRWNAPYSKELVAILCGEIYKQFCIIRSRTPKCVILDCDNVLWQGLVAEDGINNIRITRALQEFQKFLMSLYYHGVVLAICSKNDKLDVINVFKNHSSMILKEEYISCFKVNWNNKPSNIIEISQDLNIGLDSLVFIDDSPHEIYSVQASLPDVRCVLFDTKNIYSKLALLNIKYNSDFNIVNQRNNTYRTNAQRLELQNYCTTHDEYLNALENSVDIHTVKLDELSRISELTQRTNKCTNGIRYTVGQLQQLIQCEQYKLFSVFLSDKFSDLGLVGVIGINGDLLDLFSLSCRALGRNVETSMLTYASKLGANSCRWQETDKNGNLRNQIAMWFGLDIGTK